VIQVRNFLFFEQESSCALSPIHRACPEGYWTGRFTAGFGREGSKGSALQRASCPGFRQTS